MAQIHLEIEQEDGSVLKFTKEKVKARWVKEVFKNEKKFAEMGKKGDYADVLDARIQFVVNFFNKPQLTVDAIYDGIDSDKILMELDRINNEIVGKEDGEKKDGEKKNQGK